MSWSASGTVTNGEIEFTNPAPELEEAGVEQFERAKTSVRDIIFSGVVGDPAGKYTFSISGHANPEHKPASGWANDALTVMVNQV
jgi:hypothetical protein